MMRSIFVLVAWATLGSSGVAHAAERRAPAAVSGGSTVIETVTACRRVTDPGARLACYDGSVDKLAAASSGGGLVVLDREDVHAARRSLFGFSIPKLPFLETGEKAEPTHKATETESEIDAVIRSAHLVGLNEWTIVLDSGAIWATSEAPNRDPAPGDPIHIRRAALRSYLANIHGQRAVRIRRVG